MGWTMRYWHRRPWAPFCGASPGATPGSSTRWPASRPGMGGGSRAGGRASPSMSTRLSARPTACEAGRHEFTYNHVRATTRCSPWWPATGDVLHARLRGGNAHPGRGAARFLTETFTRVRMAGAAGPIVLRADSGFYNHNVVEACPKPMSASRSPPSSTKASLQGNRRHRRVGLDSHPLLLGRRRCRRDHLPALRRQRPAVSPDRAPSPAHPGQPAGAVHRVLLPRLYHRPGGRDARARSRSPPSRRDREHHPGLEIRRRSQPPASGRFGANAAWLALNVMAHNLARWSTRSVSATASSPPKHCAGATSALRAASLVQPDASHCTCRSAGPGWIASSPR